MNAPIIFALDDTLTNRELVRGVLDAEGFHPLTADNGCDAHGISRSQQPGLIPLDVPMPGEPACSATATGSLFTKEETW
jgi:CheY-like chemotaxis protein